MRYIVISSSFISFLSNSFSSGFNYFTTQKYFQVFNDMVIVNLFIKK